MGYGIMPYRVKLAEIEQLFGTSDQELASRIRNGIQARLQQLDNSFGDPSATEILTDFLDGKISHPQSGHLYWYVIEAMIRYFGTFLANGEWYPVRDEEIYKVAGTSMYHLRISKKIPSPDDFPSVYMVFHADLDKASMSIKDTDHDAAQKAQFEDWCTKAKSAGQDLVMYYY